MRAGGEARLGSATLGRQGAEREEHRRAPRRPAQARVPLPPGRFGVTQPAEAGQVFRLNCTFVKGKPKREKKKNQEGGEIHLSY